MNVEAILIGLLGSAHTTEQAEHAAKEVLSLHAHQLAERQRLRIEELDLTGQKARIIGRIVDLIDPKADQ